MGVTVIPSYSRTCYGSPDSYPREENFPKLKSVAVKRRMQELCYYRKCDSLKFNIYNIMKRRCSRRHCSVEKGSRNIVHKLNLLKMSTVLFVYALMIMTSGFITPTNADAQEETNSRTTYSHRRLGGRERREIQKELLSMLRLSHRPRPVGDPARGIQHDSAPLYMLGLYNTVSGFANIFEEHIRQVPKRDSDPNYPQKRESPLKSKKSNPVNYGSLSSNTYTADVSYGGISVGPFSDRDPFDVHVATNTAWYRYKDAQRVFTNEVGVPVVVNSDQSIQHMEMHYEANDNGLQTNSLERKLLGEADVVMSFVGTNQMNSDSDEDSKRGLLKRHRSFFFDVSHVPVEDVLTAAKFRVYKDITNPVLGNVTLRVNVYQAMVDSRKSFGLYMLGSRLVEANQEGWLVFDVTSACRDWMKNADRNLGIRVAVETLEGRSLNLNKAGIVGRRGDSSKQAFLVGFFSEKREHLPNRLKYRQKRNTNVGQSRETENTEDGFSYSKHHNSENDLYPENLDDEDLDGNDKGYSHTTARNSGQYNRDDEDLLDVNHDENGNSQDSVDETETEHDINETNDVESNDFEENGEQRGRLRRSRKKGRKNKGPRRKKQPKNYGACHRDELYVNFQDLSWEGWIIAPAGYRAYRCMGECTFPLNDNMNATNHAIVQTLVQLIRPRILPKLPKPCCSPTKLEPISVLYYDDSNNVVYKKYKNMVVKACGCQ